MSKKNDKQMDQVIERLAISKAGRETALRDLGQAAGVKWARESASFHELSNLESFFVGREDSDLPIGDFEESLESNVYEAAEMLHAVISADAEVDRGDASVFWEKNDLPPRPVDHSPWLYGFCQGAIREFESVELAVTDLAEELIDALRRDSEGVDNEGLPAVPQSKRLPRLTADSTSVEAVKKLVETRSKR